MLNLTQTQKDHISSSNTKLIYVIHLHELYVSSNVFSYNNIQYKPNFGIRLLVDDMPVWYQETGGKGPQDWLNMWMSVGRAKRRGLIWISQRYAQIPKILPTQTTGFTVFFKTQPYDRKRIRIEFGNQVASAVASVKQYGYVMASDWLPNFYEVYNPLKGRFKARPKGVELKGLD